jgi:hypothetical protein
MGCFAFNLSAAERYSSWQLLCESTNVSDENHDHRPGEYMLLMLTAYAAILMFSTCFTQLINTLRMLGSIAFVEGHLLTGGLCFQ